MELPSKVIKADRVNARNMIIFGLPKSGKTTALSKLNNCLIIDTEEGSGFVDGIKIQVPREKGPVGKMTWLKDLAEQIRKEGYPYDYVAIDTMSEVDVWSEWVGTWSYMNSMQGKAFNRVESKPGGEFLPASHPDYESVHSIPQGYGYKYSRQEMIDIYDCLQGLGKVCTIFIAHVADKAVIKLNGQEVISKDLSFTGKVRDIFSRKVDAIGYIYNKDGKAMISFKGSEEKVGGIRAKHLAGYDGELDWSKIFIQETV